MFCVLQCNGFRPLPEDDGHRISILENEIAGLRQDRRQIQSRIDSTRMYAKQSGNFENEVLEQQDRLSSIKALPKIRRLVNGNGLSVKQT